MKTKKMVKDVCLIIAGICLLVLGLTTNEHRLVRGIGIFAAGMGLILSITSSRWYNQFTLQGDVARDKPLNFGAFKVTAVIARQNVVAFELAGYGLQTIPLNTPYTVQYVTILKHCSSGQIEICLLDHHLEVESFYHFGDAFPSGFAKIEKEKLREWL